MGVILGGADEGGGGGELELAGVADVDGGSGSELVGVTTGSAVYVTVAVASTASTGVIVVVVAPVFVDSCFGGASIGSQAPSPMVVPSCSIIVGKLFRYSTTVVGTMLSVTIERGTISGSHTVGEGRERVSLDVTQEVAIGSTLICEKVL